VTGDDEPTSVSFSLSVLSPHTIDDLAPFAAQPFAARTDDDYMYGIYKGGFEEDDDVQRAGLLHELVSEALDTLDATGVSPSELTHPDVRVRAFYTFGSGAETIRSDLVQRFARINAVIWVDANT
jgi:hypothetical protein